MIFLSKWLPLLPCDSPLLLRWRDKGGGLLTCLLGGWTLLCNHIKGQSPCRSCPLSFARSEITYVANRGNFRERKVRGAWLRWMQKPIPILVVKSAIGIGERSIHSVRKLDRYRTRLSFARTKSNASIRALLLSPFRSRPSWNWNSDFKCKFYKIVSFRFGILLHVASLPIISFFIMLSNH